MNLCVRENITDGDHWHERIQTSWFGAESFDRSDVAVALSRKPCIELPTKRESVSTREGAVPMRRRTASPPVRASA